jgi:pyruvate formate-lyase/glycerol dehydratase family glycyl radical enzyme
MPLSTIDREAAYTPDRRIRRLKKAVQSARPGICTERARIWTRYHRQAANRRKPAPIQMAEALRDVLREKSIAIHPDELIVGNFASKRVGGALYPELHGVPMLEDLFKFPRRRINPLQISSQEQWQLLALIPFWARRFLAYRAFRSPARRWRFILHQLQGHDYLVNESGGIAHLAPDYAKLLRLGTDGIAAQAAARRQDTTPGTEPHVFYTAVTIIAEGLALFGERYARLAREMAGMESSPDRREELRGIAAACRQVPRKPARTLQEALQSLFFAQIALNLESLDNSICPGRMDQYLYPFYEQDVRCGRLTPDRARILVAAFSIKMAEIVPVFSERLTRFHGGLFNGQVVTVGGTTPEGQDAVNDLSMIFLDVMNALRMRQPNYHARLHRGAPPAYLARIRDILADGGNSPALYNDEVIVETLCRQGSDREDARDYPAVGCVEPVSQGRSFASTDAALVNVPLLLERALNEGRRFGARRRSGAKTPPAARMTSMAEVTAAFETQLRWQLDRLVKDLHAVENANRRFHPTPLASMLLDGCLERGVCSTAGGARYNFSGVQCVGPADTGDALYAIEQAVFKNRRIALVELVSQLKANLPDEDLRAYLRGLEKFGNDAPEVDRWTRWVVETFARILGPYRNTRGGVYVAGLYSVTAHQAFGSVTGALPHGRRKGAPLASGIAPGNGQDRKGPTALLNSLNRLDFSKTANGINFNIKFDKQALRGQAGRLALQSLIKTYFRRGGMQMQVNVFDTDLLRRACEHPDAYPHLLVRVSGYSAYFNDLTPEMKAEIIQRRLICAGRP